MEFKIKPNKLYDCSNRIRNIADENISNVISIVNSVIDGISDISYDVKTPLEKILINLTNNKKKLILLSESLNNIVQKYENVESDLSHVYEYSNEIPYKQFVDNMQTIPTSQRGIWGEIIDLCGLLGLSLRKAWEMFTDLVGLLASAGYEAATGWVDGYDWEQWLYEYIPEHVHDTTLLAVFSILSADGIPFSETIDHYQSNLIGWESYVNAHPEDLYIEHQEDMTNILLYGDHWASYNSCEVIAAYNALVALNDGDSPASFPELLATFECDGIMWNGDFGTHPVDIYSYFIENGYDAELLYGGDVSINNVIDMQSEYSTYILTAYNDQGDLSEQIHTVSITQEEVNGQTVYVVHNGLGESQFTSLAAAVNDYNGGNGESITLIGIK